MATTAEYLTQLQTDKANIINALKDQGVEIEDTAKFNEFASKIENIGSSRLPSGYQEVEYIKSSGENQYIITNVIPNQDTVVEMKLQMLSSKIQFLYGARDGVSVNSYGIGYISSKYRFDYANTTANVQDASATADVIRQEGNELYINGTLAKTITKSTFTPSKCTSGIYLFNISTGNAIGTSEPARFANMTLYYYKIWQDEELVRDFVPCYRKSDQAIGLFDLVSSTFFENQGATPFEKGSNVHKIFLEEKDITENGTYNPDTGYAGFSKVIVNVSGSGEYDLKQDMKQTDIAIKLCNNGIYDLPESFYSDKYVTKVQELVDNLGGE